MQDVQDNDTFGLGLERYQVIVMNASTHALRLIARDQRKFLWQVGERETFLAKRVGCPTIIDRA